MSADGPRGPEEQIARLVVAADAELLPPVADFVRQTARRLGLTGESAAHLQEAVEVVCRNVVENAFGPDDDGRYDVLVLHRPGRVVVAVEDLGLPGDYERFEGGEDSAFSEMLRRSFADEIHFLNLGRGGNRVELSKDLPHADVRDHVPEDEHRETAHAPAAADDAQIEIRSMLPEETPALARAVYRSYGYSYDWDDIYYPERVRELQESGLMRSCVAVDDEEIVGHLALTLERPDSPVAEAGQAVVDPRYRGHHLFPKMKTFLADRAREDGIYGLYSEATAVHPYSQKGNLHLGARETGYLLGYIPASVSYKEIGDKRAGRRGSVALMYLRTNREPDRVVYPPNPYESVVRRVVEHNGLRRTLAEAEPPELSISRMSVNVRRDHNVAFLRVAEPGADLAELVQARLRELCVHRVDCIYVDLPLSHPATQSVRLDGLGFFFGCVIPEGAGAFGGDVLRLQYLNNVEVESGDVSTASPFGEELLDLIFGQRAGL